MPLRKRKVRCVARKYVVLHKGKKRIKLKIRKFVCHNTHASNLIPSVTTAAKSGHYAKFDFPMFIVGYYFTKLNYNI